MDRRLLMAAGLAAALTLSGQAQAQARTDTWNHDGHSGHFRDGFRDGRRSSACEDGEHRHSQSTVICEGWVYADGQWALYNNRSWAPDSYNDWWNDRPDRAYPRWVQEQHKRGTCSADRMWWSGSGWHC